MRGELHPRSIDVWSDTSLTQTTFSCVSRVEQKVCIGCIIRYNDKGCFDMLQGSGFKISTQKLRTSRWLFLTMAFIHFNLNTSRTPNQIVNFQSTTVWGATYFWQDRLTYFSLSGSSSRINFGTTCVIPIRVSSEIINVIMSLLNTYMIFYYSNLQRQASTRSWRFNALQFEPP
jgi:hypothetical protein